MKLSTSVKLLVLLVPCILLGCDGHEAIRKEIKSLGGNYEIETGTVSFKGKSVDDKTIQVLRKVNVKLLSLVGTSVTDEGLATLLAEMKDLKVVNLADTNVGDETAIVIAGLPKIRTVRLNNTQVTDAGIKPFATKSLHFLGLHGTKVSDEVVESLKNVEELITPDGRDLKPGKN